MAADIARWTEDLGSWYLEEYRDDGHIFRRHRLRALPFRIGRGRDADAALAYGPVSSRHAEIYARGGQLWLRDLDSRNGTMKNGEKVTGEVRLEEGDVLRFAHVECLLRREAEASRQGEQTVLYAVDSGPETSHAANAAALRELVRERRVTSCFQPIVEFADPGNIAFELLGRGAHPRLPAAPAELLAIAQRIGREIDLSRLFCAQGVRTARALPDDAGLFINIHPAELHDPGLPASLRSARAALPDRRITVEVHETSITDPDRMRAFRVMLTDLELGLAYDDFGAGQARLLELVEVPPDFLKFDISLVRDIDRAPEARQKMLETLVAMVAGMGIACLAEGIERREELEVCRQMGFRYGQGYLLGRPAPSHAWTGADRERARAAEDG